MSDRALVDSNILIYAVDAAYPEKQRVAHNLLEEGLAGKRSLVLALQNVNEFFVNITQKAIKPMQDAHVLAEDLLSKFPCYPDDQNTVEYAFSLCRLYKIPFWDALIAAVMLENTILTIYTENEQDFRKIPGIKVVNPFRK